MFLTNASTCVGIAGFRLPIRYRLRAGGDITLETAVTALTAEVLELLPRGK